MAYFVFIEKLGDHADHFAAMGHHAIGNQPHQPHTPAAIDEIDTRLGQQLAKVGGCRAVGRVHGSRRSTVNTNGFHRRHIASPRAPTRISLWQG